MHRPDGEEHGSERSAPFGAAGSLRDVARLAGVSISTASRVLSGSTHPVGQETRERVHRAANDLNFKPNLLARALATSRSHTVGVMVHDVSDPYYAEITRGLEDVASSFGYAVFVGSSNRDAQAELSGIRAFLSHHVDAIVLAGSEIASAEHRRTLQYLLASYRARGGVVVTLSESSLKSVHVGYDNRAATGAAVRHLIELGHRLIGFLSGPPNLVVSSVRQKAYEDTLQAAGLKQDPALVACGCFSIRGGAEATRKLLSSSAPSAILGANDLMAIGSIRSLLDLGYRVPEDISVAGINDIEFAAYCPVSLTTVHIPLRELGRTAAETAIYLINGELEREGVEITAELVVRDSTGAAPY